MTQLIDLGKLRFNFTENWSSNTTYEFNDIVKYGGNLYVYGYPVKTSGLIPTTNTAHWSLITEGFSYKGNWSANTQYYIGQTVTYGGSLFQANTDSLNVNPTTANTWFKIVYGLKNRGNWTTSTTYEIDDVVVYGGNNFIALQPHTSGIFATDLASFRWQKFSGGIDWKTDWSANTFYKVDDVVSYGGSTFVALQDHTANTFATDLASFRWQKFSGGIDWKGDWSANTFYKVNDIVKSANSAYIAITDHTANLAFSYDLNNNKWTEFVVGGANVIPSFAFSDIGKSLSALQDGSNYGWVNPTGANNVYYVASHGSDTVNNGKSLSTPYSSIKYACEQVPNNSTIFVKTGTYQEILPIVVPPGVSIIGDSQRTVIVQPSSGYSGSGNTMWLLSDKTLLKQMTFSGMTGFLPAGNTDNITEATLGGVFVAFNPSSPVVTKSPYVLECSAISNGGIGAIVDGSVHATGFKSMLFHAYTNINNDGVGLWVSNNGRAEVVSCFTYFAYFGFAATSGGFIRGLNNNNSYGKYGAVSRGFDSNEITLDGYLYGEQLQLSNNSSISFVNGELITGNTSNASGTILNIQTAAKKLYYYLNSGTFLAGETITGNTSNTTALIDADGVTGQKGFVLVVRGFNSEPSLGNSLQFANSVSANDSSSYVISSISGTYVNSNSNLIIVLNQEKTSDSPNGAFINVRSLFSQIRLTGHDFLDVGTGNTTTSNIGGIPLIPPSQGNEVVESKPGRVYYVSTDQNGNFRVGDYFKVDQATGRATLDASAFDLSGLTSLRLGSIGAQLGETINEFSSDETLSGASNLAVPTEFAVKTYVDVVSTRSNSAFDQANTTRTHANAAFVTANAAFNSQNVTSNVANSVFVLANNQIFTPTYNSSNITYNSDGFITFYKDSLVTTSNIVYNSSNLPISWIETSYTNVSYNYTVTYFSNNTVNTISRI